MTDNMQIPQETIQDVIENILYSTPFETEQEVKKDFLFRLSKFYEYEYKELKGGDLLISKGGTSFKLTGEKLDLGIKKALKNKLSDNLTNSN